MAIKNTNKKFWSLFALPFSRANNDQAELNRDECADPLLVIYLSSKNPSKGSGEEEPATESHYFQNGHILSSRLR